VKLKSTVFATGLLALLLAAACQSNTPSNDAGNIVVVNAPATGKVKRIVAAEGVHVERGTPLVEIAVESEPVKTASPTGVGAEARAAQNYQAADAEIEAARAEVVRHEAEVGRLTPLVSSGEASQGQLDGERALYEQAQRRLTQAKQAKQNAEGALLAARQPNQISNPGSQVSGDKSQGTNAPAAREQIVSAVAVSPGKVAVISVRVGEAVKLGQPLATIREE
jgi:multidrug efflux pump subunit AcrA (membrane-fusion protein)